MSSRPLLSFRVTGGCCAVESHGQNVTLCFSVSTHASVWVCMFARVSSTCMCCRTRELKRAETAGRGRHNNWQQQQQLWAGTLNRFSGSLLDVWVSQGGCAGSEVGLTWSDIWSEIKHLSWEWAINTSTLAVNGVSHFYIHQWGGFLSPHALFFLLLLMSSAVLVLHCLPWNELDASLSLLVLLCLCVHGL